VLAALIATAHLMRGDLGREQAGQIPTDIF
jgi:hypothetical protein